MARLGVEGNVHPGFHASWCFAGYTGPEQIKWAKTVSAPRHQGPSVINEMIVTPAAEAELSEYSKHKGSCHRIRKNQGIFQLKGLKSGCSAISIGPKWGHDQINLYLLSTEDARGFVWAFIVLKRFSISVSWKAFNLDYDSWKLLKIALWSQRWCFIVLVSYVEDEQKEAVIWEVKEKRSFWHVKASTL